MVVRAMPTLVCLQEEGNIERAIVYEEHAISLQIRGLHFTALWKGDPMACTVVSSSQGEPVYMTLH